MALISTLTDNFNDNSIDTAKWDILEENGGTVSEVNQEIEITSSTTAESGGYLSSNTTYDLTGSAMTIKIVDAGNQAYTSWLVDFMVYSGSGSLRFRITNGNITVRNDTTTVATATYVANTHRYLKIRESGGTTYFDYSSTGLDGSWTNFHSILNSGYGANQTAFYAIMQAYANSSEAGATTAKFDDFNILPSAVTGGYMTANTKFWG